MVKINTTSLRGVLIDGMSGNPPNGRALGSLQGLPIYVKREVEYKWTLGQMSWLVSLGSKRRKRGILGTRISREEGFR